jgi:DNA-binding transcriptional LysR family regulator
VADLNALLIFAKVAEAGSFSEAARRIGMPVSSVSRRIAELEDRLGIRLLERSTRSLRLTDAGSDLLQEASRIAELNDRIESVVSNTLTEVTGTLRLSAPPSLSDILLVPIVRAFQASFPKVRVALFITQRLIDPIADGIDLMLRVGELKDSSLVARRLARYRHRLVASPAYLASVRGPSHPRDLADHRLLAFSQDATSRRWSFGRAEAEPWHVDFAPSLAMNDYSGIAHAAESGIGIAELPPMIAAPLLASGALVEVMPGWHLPDRDLSLLHAGSRHVPRAVRLFKDLATQMIVAQAGTGW